MEFLGPAPHGRKEEERQGEVSASDWRLGLGQGQGLSRLACSGLILCVAFLLCFVLVAQLSCLRGLSLIKFWIVQNGLSGV